jgi:hypothetical protein
MLNSSEVPINAVSHDKPKMLTGLDQKVSGQAQVLLTHLTQMLSHRRRGTTSPTWALTRNVVSRSRLHGRVAIITGASLTRNVVSRSPSLPDGRESNPQGEPMGMPVEEGGESQGRSVMDRRGIEPRGKIIPRASGPTSAWSLVTRALVNDATTGVR